MKRIFAIDYRYSHAPSYKGYAATDYVEAGSLAEAVDKWKSQHPSDRVEYMRDLGPVEEQPK